MPVVDLAQYLGMPQQAPADPLFYQNQRKAAIDREVGDFTQRAGARDQLYRLQRQAPVFQAQQAQNAYDEVAQQARDLRMKQEIEAQVERAASELAGGNLNPESDDFAVKYRELATRNPLAFSDPRFSNVAGLYANQFQNYQQTKAQRAEAEARAAQARIDAENAAYAFGVPAGTITPGMSIKDINIERGKIKTAGAGLGAGAKDVTGQMMQKDYELVSSEIDRIEKAGKEVIHDKDGTEIPNPTYEKLLMEKDRLFNDLRGSYQSKYQPSTVSQAAAPAAQQPQAGATPAPSPQAAPSGGQPQVVLPEIPLTAFEQQQKQQAEARAAEEAQKQQSSMEAWSAAKNQAMMKAAPLQGIDPVRIINLSKKAVVGGPVEGTEQEKKIINRIAGYARAAVEDKTFDVGVPVKGPSGKVEIVKSKATPGWALLIDFNLDPREVIKIPGQGVFGTTKTMYAGDLMDLRLKEIGQPLLAVRKESDQKSVIKAGEADALIDEADK